MRKIFTLALFIASSIAVSAQTTVKQDAGLQAVKADVGGKINATSDQPAPVAETISFQQTEHDFGKIPQGKPVTYVFEFKNSGTSPLKLDNVQASCGCTTPEWNKDEVAAGATSKITVGYNAASEGPFTKTITVTYNGGASKLLTIRGEVWKTPATSAPENGSLNNLKH